MQPDGRPYKGEREGLSVFVRDGDRVFHSYSAYQRGLDLLLNTYNLLDLTPAGPERGRQDHVVGQVPRPVRGLRPMTGMEMHHHTGHPGRRCVRRDVDADDGADDAAIPGAGAGAVSSVRARGGGDEGVRADGAGGGGLLRRLGRAGCGGLGGGDGGHGGGDALGVGGGMAAGRGGDGASRGGRGAVQLVEGAAAGALAGRVGAELPASA